MQIRSLLAGHFAMMSAAFALAGTSSAAAESAACGHAGRPWVSVSFGEGSWRESFKEEALQDLKAGLISRNIEACARTDSEETPPLAAIVISSSGEENVRVTVEIHDAVTEKRVSRDVDLTRMPLDGRALALAVAADELVWATWAEIALGGPKRRTPAPKEVVAGVEHAVKPPAAAAQPALSAKRTQLGIQLAGEHFAAGLTLLGADAVATVPITASFRLKLAAGARQGLTIVTEEGRIQSVAANMAIDGSLLILKGPNARLGWALGPRLAWVRMQGEAQPGSLGHRFSGIAVIARTGPVVEIRLGLPLWLKLDAGMGVPLRAVQATDSGHIVAGASGFEQSVALSLQGEL